MIHRVARRAPHGAPRKDPALDKGLQCKVKTPGTLPPTTNEALPVAEVYDDPNRIGDLCGLHDFMIGKPPVPQGV